MKTRFDEKNTKYVAMKTQNKELTQKLQRMESKLGNMSKFSHIFIKSIKSQNLSLRDQVVKQQQDFDSAFEATIKTIQHQVSTRLA